MIDLKLFGSTELRRDGRPLDSLLAGSKRFALLIYLVLAGSRGFHRREKLLAMFWPERSEESARGALSNMLYHIRRELGDDVVLNRGAEEIGLNGDRLRCDVIEFEAALDRGDARKALELYRGDLLRGFHFSGASADFDLWLDQERERLRMSAGEGAWGIAEAAEAAGDYVEARKWARKAAAFTPFSDEGQARLIKLLARVGDRVGAREAYEAFEARLRDEWDMEPTDEVKALVVNMDASLPDRGNAKPSNGGEHTPNSRTAQPANLLDTSAPSPPSSRMSRWALITLAVAAVLGVGLLAWASSQRGLVGEEAAASPRGVSVAVLPFTYLGAEDSTDYFSLGMTEEILTRLAQVGDLSVISRTSVMPYVHTDKSLREIADELGASVIVEGSVQREGGRVRIMAQLIDADMDRHLWSQSYDREITNILSIQSEVAARIAEALRAQLLPDVLYPSAAEQRVDETAYHFYLRAQHRRHERSPAGALEAITLYREAVRRDSTFAPAWAGLAMAAARSGLMDVALNSSLTGVTQIPEETAAAMALEAADRALSLDSTTVMARLARALVLRGLRGEHDRSMDEFQRALAIAPGDGSVRREYGASLLFVGSVTDALLQLEKAVALDPLSPLVHHDLGYAYYCDRQYERAIQGLTTALELGSENPITKKYLYMALLKRAEQLVQTGESEAAELYLGRALPLLQEFWPEPGHGAMLVQTVRRPEHREAFAAAFEDPNVPFTIRWYGNLLLGRQEQALELVAEHFPPDRYHVDPVFDSIRNEPRFAALVRERLRREHVQDPYRTAAAGRLR